jgi:hypothetical protein
MLSPAVHQMKDREQCKLVFSIDHQVLRSNCFGAELQVSVLTFISSGCYFGDS